MIGDIERRDRHAVQRERARLVGADDGDGTQRLDRRQLADKRLSLQHALRAERQGDGDYGGQRFRHCGHGQADCSQQQLLDICSVRGATPG